MKKIDIPKEKLIELYVDKQLTMFEISEIYNVDRTTISNKLKEYSINNNPTVRKYKILKATPFTNEQKELILGSLLGDASIIKRIKTSYFKVGHCEKQKEYVLWKKSILGNFVNQITKCVDKRGNSIMYNFNTLSHHELNYYRNLFYDNNKKIIQKELISKFTSPLSLAVWYMDDGSRGKYNCRFATDCFSENENKVLVDLLKINFDIKTKIAKYTRNNIEYCFLTLNKPNTLKLFNIINPYIVDCVKYKIFPEFHCQDCSSTTTCQNQEYLM